ncbi:VOC family protein [Acuticoccus sp.]|uniref:VOC family protein n=1 Tax=Acuticoccus sp. TaxID=1904378 RepID=UPI003B5182AC
MAHKPEGYPTVSPYLLVPDPQALLDFAASAFGAEPLRVIPDGAGRILHAEFRIEDSVVMLGGMPGGPGGHLHLYLADPDAAFLRAVDAGAEEVQPMTEKGDGDRRGGVRDPSGTTWWLSRQL